MSPSPKCILIAVLLVSLSVPVLAGIFPDPQSPAGPEMQQNSSGWSHGCVSCGNPAPDDPGAVVSDAEVMSMVDEINAGIRENGWDWVAGPTSIMYLPEETREAMRGLKHDNTPAAGSMTPEEPTGIGADVLPESFSWEDYSGNFLTPVKNQGRCGSCWAFAITAAFESYWEIKKRNPDLDPDFAEQILVSCAKDQDGCGGGYFYAMKYLVGRPLGGRAGTVREKVYPYVARNTACKNLGTIARYRAGRWGYVAGGTEWSIPSEDAIREAVYIRGPVVAGVYADDNFDAYMSGIFSSRPTKPGYSTNHAVLIYGWDVTGDGRTYWKVKNSYGRYWGEAGHFRIYADQNRIGEGAAWFSAA